MGVWSEETVDGHLCDVYEPSRLHGEHLVLLYLHGVHLQRLIDKQPYLDEFEKHGVRVVAPMTNRSWWSDRICPEFSLDYSAEKFVLDRVLPWIESRWSVAPPNIGLFGTSMGGQGALRLAYKYPDRFPVVAGVSPAIDYQSRFAEGDEVLQQMYRNEEDVRQNTALLHIHPLNWPRQQFLCCDPADERWWDSADRLAMKLYSLGIAHEADLETTGGGHSFEYYNRMAPRVVEFLVASLEKERRRLPVV